MQKQIAFEKIKSLVQRFDEQKEFYKKADYNETQTRRDFIDPFWKALGWDIDNENGYAESYREVIHEDRVKVGGATKAPDYSFRLVGGKRLFFLEAKKPSVFIKDDIQPAYQVRRYGWSAKMPISVITDFEEFAIYDCSNKPKPTDKASNGRIKYLQYSDYLNDFNFIWETFSKEYVLKGSFDKYITSDKNKKGTTTVDNEFLLSLDKWRVELAINIALRNKDINEEELNFVVQHTIDRLIFLRIAEDRSAEPYGELQTDIKTGTYYQNLLFRFHQADQKYNSGLFDFKKDKISEKITIDNKVIKNIISELYYPICPYEFSVLSVEILGSAYEQFLGKQITLSKTGKAVIEEKPEVRKAGGVYYTPQYIVDYIVKNTVGKLVDGSAGSPLTPKEVSKLKICDPACGSGSFLIGAYQFLLNWHKDYYNKLRIKNDELRIKGRKDDVLTPTGELTTAEKKRILLNNIYGVDLDSNAVEVTKLSLLLKCMEGETKETIEAQTKLFHDRILPTLDNNIKSGNSLIDLDYYDNELNFGEERKVKPFSWQKAFPEVFNPSTGSGGGFDCVIGNPPYVSIENLSEESKAYFFKKYKTCKGRTDIYVAFIEKNLEYITKNGFISFIIPYAFTNQNYGTLLRQKLIDDYFIKEIVDTSKYFVFSSAVVKNIILTIQHKPSKAKSLNTRIIKVNSEADFIAEKFDVFETEQQIFRTLEDSRLETKPVGSLISLKEKIWESSIPLSNICLIAYGARLNHKTKNIGKEHYISDKKEKGFKPFLEGKNIERYSFSQYGWLNYTPNEHYNSMFPELFENEKIMFINVVKDRLRFAYDNKGFYNSHTIINCVRIDKLIKAEHISARKAIKETDLKLCTKYDYKFLLGILNSNLINWYFRNFLSEDLHFYPNDAKNLPIKLLDKNNDKQQTEIIKLVEQLLQLNQDKQNVTLPNQIEMIENRIEHAEDKINQMVYELYELTTDEIKLIENQ
ncbi:MAG: N-6 DNA methylase [Bacteroidia bacterium]|nr:N-6 DNA methylase [Bacteroidia bacterium]